MDERDKNTCPECDPLSRREFLKSAGLAAVAGAAAVSLPAVRCFAVPKAAPVAAGARQRVAGHSVPNRAFGGPIFYGHAITFNEKPHHPGNVFWYQAQRANEVYQALDGKQREQALIAVAPQESAIRFRGDHGPLPGIPMTALSRDQQELVH